MYIIIKYREQLKNVLLFFYCFDIINISDTQTLFYSQTLMEPK